MEKVLPIGTQVLILDKIDLGECRNKVGVVIDNTKTSFALNYSLMTVKVDGLNEIDLYDDEYTEIVNVGGFISEIK